MDTLIIEYAFISILPGEGSAWQWDQSSQDEHNNQTSIVGTGDRRFTGETFPNSRAYLLIPTTGGEIPEPGTVMLLAGGVALALVARCRLSSCR